MLSKKKKLFFSFIVTWDKSFLAVMVFFLSLVILSSVIEGSNNDTSSFPLETFSPDSSPEQVVNGNIQYLFSLPVERIHLFATSSDDEERVGKPLLPNWMREDLNRLALVLYENFLSTVDVSERDERDASWIINQFKLWQLKEKRINETSNLLELVGEENRALAESYEGFRKLLPKIGIDFTDKMGATAGSRHVFQARLWAEVFTPGDALSPTFMGSEGAQVVGVVHTNLPRGIKGSPTFEIIDPRGQNPPFGKDRRYVAKTGLGILMPGWVTRMTPPHRCCEPGTDASDDLERMRIDWIFEIGLFQYSSNVLTRYVDFENCPFANSHDMLMTQNFFDLDLQTLVHMRPPPEVMKRIEMAAGASGSQLLPT